MADQSYAEFIQAFAKANVPLKKHTKGIQLLAVKYKLLDKAFGPFLDLFLQTKQIGQAVGEAFESLTKPTEEVTEGMEDLGKALGLVGGNFRIIMSSLILMVGIVMAIVGVVYLMAGSFGNMDSILPGISDRFSLLMGVFEGLKDSVMNFISMIATLDFSPILDGIKTVVGVVFQLSSAALVVAGIITTAFFDLLTAMYSAGLGQAIIDSIGVILGSFQDFFNILSMILGESEVTFGDVIAVIQGSFDKFIGFLESSGIFEFMADVFTAVGEAVVLVMKVLGVIIGSVIVFVAMLSPILIPIWKQLKMGTEIIVLVIIGAFRIVLAGFRGLVALLSGDIDGFLAHCESIIDIFTDITDRVSELFGQMVDHIMDYLGPLLEGIGTIGEGIGGFIGGGMDLLGFSEGGVAKGPTSGYPVALHGTEAIVPLPNGRSIPVEMKGSLTQAGGGDNITVNISVSGGGNANEIAKKVSDEVARAFRNRSRSNGFTRGI